MIYADPSKAFSGRADLADGVRMVMFLFGIILLFVIARAVRESYTYKELGPGQVKRFGALALLDIADVFGGAHNLGRGAYWTLWAALIGLILAWWGTLDLRKEQLELREGPRAGR